MRIQTEQSLGAALLKLEYCNEFPGDLVKLVILLIWSGVWGGRVLEGLRLCISHSLPRDAHLRTAFE